MMVFERNNYWIKTNNGILDLTVTETKIIDALLKRNNHPLGASYYEIYDSLFGGIIPEEKELDFRNSLSTNIYRIRQKYGIEIEAVTNYGYRLKTKIERKKDG